MRRFFNTIFTAACALLMFTACSDEDRVLSDVAIIVSPGTETAVTLQSGEKALYEVSLTTAHEYISGYKVTSFDPVRGLTVLADAPCDKKTYSFQLPYTAPELENESSEVILTFEATDNKGNSAAVKRRLTVINRNMTMSEKTGILLFMPGIGLPDALSLEDVANPFSLADSPTPEKADIIQELLSGTDRITWRSNTQAKFVRYNQFNYAGATASGIRSVYNNSLRTDHISDISVNDIIIIGHGTEAQGVFYVVSIIPNGQTPGFLQLNYKGIVGADSPAEPEQPTEPDEDETSV